MSEPIECSACLFAAPYDEASDSYDLDGWNLEGEFGVLCPGCAGEGGPSGPMAVELTEKDAEGIAQVTQDDKDDKDEES